MFTVRLQETVSKMRKNALEKTTTNFDEENNYFLLDKSSGKLL